jgi:hypothetical protein
MSVTIRGQGVNIGVRAQGPNACASRVGGDVTPERQGPLLGLVVENNDARRCLMTMKGVEVGEHEYKARRLDLI